MLCQLLMLLVKLDEVGEVMLTARQSRAESAGQALLRFHKVP